MSKERSRHRARKGRRRLNRADLAILLCGVLAFLGITFGSPLLSQNHPAAARSIALAETSSSPATDAPVQPRQTPAPAEAQIQPDQGTTTAPEPALPEASAPGHISYPAAGFDVPVHALEPDADAQASQTIVPPETKDGYWLTPYGTPGRGSGNTTYVIGHSWDGADAPFNHLSSSANVGDRFTVQTGTGTITYQVDNVATYLKASLKDSPIWDIVPNRLVLISCYTQDPWGKNVVVTASPAAS